MATRCEWKLRAPTASDQLCAKSMSYTMNLPEPSRNTALSVSACKGWSLRRLLADCAGVTASFRSLFAHCVSDTKRASHCQPCHLWEQGNQADKVVEVRTLCRMTNSEVVQMVLKKTSQDFFSKNGLLFRHVKTSSDHRTEMMKRRLTHLGQIVTMKIGSSLWSAAHLSTWRVRTHSLLITEQPPTNQ